MLILTRKLLQQLMIDHNIKITVVKIDRNCVRLGIEAPPTVKVLRDELVQGIRAAPVPAQPQAIAPGTMVYWWHDRGKTLRAGSFAEYTRSNLARVYNVFKLAAGLATPRVREDWIPLRSRDGDPNIIVSTPLFATLKEAKENRPRH